MQKPDTKKPSYLNEPKLSLFTKKNQKKESFDNIVFSFSGDNSIGVTMILEALSPANRAFRDFLSDRSERRASTGDLLSRDEYGNQRFLMPTGENTYDSFISYHVAEMGNETEQEVRAIAKQVPKTYIEEKAPWMVHNEYYIFIVDKFKIKYKHGKTVPVSGNIFHYFWYFSSKLGKDQIMYRIRIMLSRILRCRASKIEKKCKQRGFNPYKGLKAVVDMFNAASEQLRKYSDGIIYTDKTKKSEKLQVAPLEKTKEASGVLMNHIRQLLPKIYDPMKAFFSIEYPELCGPPPPNPH